MLHAGGDTRVVQVMVNGGGMHNVLVKNVQREPVGHRLLHADFYAVNMAEKQRVTVPVTMTGKPAGMTTGMMVLTLHESIHVEALPADIPGEIEVDISPLTLDRPITIADLPQVKGVTYVDDIDEVLFNLQLTREEVAEEAAAEAEAEPEVVKRGKQTDEDEE
jgi:large subunit ribosomal protein L25